MVEEDNALDTAPAGTPAVVVEAEVDTGPKVLTVESNIIHP